MTKKYRYVNGVKLYSFISFDELIDYAMATKSILVALNSDKLYYCDDKLKQIINQNIGYPDGIGAVWALKRKGINSVKLAGCELWLKIIQRYPNSSYYLIGAEQEVIIKVVDKLKSEYSSINIYGYKNGFFNEGEEKSDLIKDIKRKKPDFVFVAMGSPKQEYFLHELHERYTVPMVGLGGSFNVYSGKVKRAPQWMINLNIETLYRYFFNNIKLRRIMSDVKFLFALILNKL